MQRKLTVILSADVVGYSALMERDEAGTLARLKANRATVFDPRVAAHGGRVFKLMGDGALVEFGSVVAAVNCAREIQAATAASAPGGEPLRYRIGLNLGEVIVEGDDIYGDGVNVAARIQALADPGGVTLSRTVRDQVAGKVAVAIDDLGEHAVKNIERPVHVFALRADVPAAMESATPARPQRLSICVLPFANMSGDPEQEYFSDGVTEDIITDLSKVSALSVVSRNSAFTFKGKHTEIAQVARALKVTHVLEGSVRKAGNRVRITAQLIEAATDSHLWAERYDRDLNDIFALQDEISEAIVDALKLKLLPAEKKAIEQRSTTNPEAYKLYLMARQYNATGNSRHRDIAIRLCRRAVEIDPTYARAWAMLALCQSNKRLVDAVDLATPAGTPPSARWRCSRTSRKRTPRRAASSATRAVTKRRWRSTARQWRSTPIPTRSTRPPRAATSGCDGTPRRSSAWKRRRPQWRATSGRSAWRSSATRQWATSKVRSPPRAASWSASRRSSSPSPTTASQSAGA